MKIPEEALQKNCSGKIFSEKLITRFSPGLGSHA